MQRGRGGRDPFFDFGDPFASFGAFGDPFAGFGNFGGSGRRGSLLSSFFGGRDPFDDPFFTRPFGGMFDSSFFVPGGGRFQDMYSPAMIEHQAPEARRSRGPIIEELNSDEEKQEAEQNTKGNPKKHGRSSSEPYVENPDDEADERRNRRMLLRHDRGYYHPAQPQTRSFTFQSSSVSYGGANGAYYTSSKTRRTGSDGVTIEDSREADTATREASHRISRALHNKGHSVTRKLNSDGRVDTMQTLHNLNEDELPGFERAWDGSVRKHLPGWPGDLGGNADIVGSRRHAGQAGQGGWALPGTEHSQLTGGLMPDARAGPEPSRAQPSGRMKAPMNVRDRSGHSQGKARN